MIYLALTVTALAFFAIGTFNRRFDRKLKAEQRAEDLKNDFLAYRIEAQKLIGDLGDSLAEQMRRVELMKAENAYLMTVSVQRGIECIRLQRELGLQTVAAPIGDTTTH